MWLYTVFGFFSVVSAGDDRFQVRARERSHLEALCRLMDWALTRIQATPHADYAFRILVTRTQWLDAARQLADEVEHVPNVKGATAQRGHGESYLDLMHQVWSLTARYLSTPGSRGQRGLLW